MLLEITAENIAIVERGALTFGPGFTAITGETGAGKSLLVDAISLCLGERADSDMVRAGASRAVVQAVFEPGREALTAMKELGIETEDGLLYVQREVAAEGRSQCRVNGKLAPLSALKRIGDALADLHGQHEHQSLLNPASHLGLLDAWTGAPAMEMTKRAEELCGRRNNARSRLKELERDEREREQRLDLLRFQVNEIEDAGVRVGELAEIDAELKRLKNAEELASLLAKSAEASYSGETAARDLLSESLRSMEAAAELDPRLAKAVDGLRSALFALDEAVDELREQEGGVEFNPERLEELAARQDLIARLRRKHGDTEEEVLEFLENARGSLERIQQADETREALQAELAAVEEELLSVCGKLTKARKAAAAEMSGRVQSELRELSMPGARLSVRMEPKEPEADGADAVELLFSANPGEPERPLAKIASGGEISRVMLAIKVAHGGTRSDPSASRPSGPETLIFDEVDSGLGGQTAAVVGRKLERLAERFQVIVITHVPQIASRAGSQVSVEKREQDGRSVTVFRPLKPEERVEEIARMLGGEETGAAAIENARQLLGFEA